jgi:hypothetical protein
MMSVTLDAYGLSLHLNSSSLPFEPTHQHGKLLPCLPLLHYYRNSFKDKHNRTVVVQNKSSLILQIIFTITQALQLFTKEIKKEIINKSF